MILALMVATALLFVVFEIRFHGRIKGRQHLYLLIVVGCYVTLIAAVISVILVWI